MKLLSQPCLLFFFVFNGLCAAISLDTWGCVQFTQIIRQHQLITSSAHPESPGGLAHKAPAARSIGRMRNRRRITLSALEMISFNNYIDLKA